MEKLRIYGSSAQQERYFAQASAGALITNAGAERGGKVVGEIRTTLSHASNGYRLNGVKHYCTGSAYADAYYVLAMHPEGGKALAMVPADRAGTTTLDDWDGMGQRTSASGTVRFEDVALAADEVIMLKGFGQRPTHEGATAQILHAAIDAGIAQAAFEDALGLGREGMRAVPESGVATTAEDPYVQHAVGEMAMAVHGAIALVERGAAFTDRAAAAFLRGESAERLLGAASVAVAEAKMAAEAVSLKVGEMLFQVAGASATSRARDFDRHWRNARTHTTHDPVSYKAKVVGDFYLNDRLPPISTKY
jgi:alkylation response protein AidB-like acyl-CoA dehydrogenase